MQSDIWTSCKSVDAVRRVMIDCISADVSKRKQMVDIVTDLRNEFFMGSAEDRLPVKVNTFDLFGFIDWQSRGQPVDVITFDFFYLLMFIDWQF